MNRNFHTAKEMLRAATTAGFRIKVWGGGDKPDYAGPDPMAAWQAVVDTEAAEITLHGPKLNPYPDGWAYLMADGPGTCAPQETVVDCSTDGWLAEWMAANRPNYE